MLQEGKRGQLTWAPSFDIAQFWRISEFACHVETFLFLYYVILQSLHSIPYSVEHLASIILLDLPS